MAMKLDHEDLNRLIEKISTSDIQEFSLEGEDFKLEIKRNLFDQTQLSNNLVSNPSFDRQPIAQKSINDNVSIVNEPEAPQAAPIGRSDLTEITSPMVGTFYRAAAPDEEPFVEVGRPQLRVLLIRDHLADDAKLLPFCFLCHLPLPV